MSDINKACIRDSKGRLVSLKKAKWKENLKKGAKKRVENRQLKLQQLKVNQLLSEHAYHQKEGMYNNKGWAINHLEGTWCKPNNSQKIFSA